jgi:hypothetical protein
LDGPVSEKKLHIALFPAAVAEEGELCSVNLTVTGETFSLSRHLSGRDGLTFRYVVSAEDGEVEGKKYVERMETLPAMPLLSRGCGRIVTEPSDVDSALAEGCRKVSLFINLPDFVLLYPEGEDTLLWRWDGREYFIRKSAALHVDGLLTPLRAAGAEVTLVLVNAREWLFTAGERQWESLRYPGASPLAEYAMFDVARAAGCGYFGAFVSFLKERYAPSTMVIGYDMNRVSEYGNMGEVSLPAFAEAYATALRVAYQATGCGAVEIAAAVDGCLDTPREGALSAGEVLAALQALSEEEGLIPFAVFADPEEGDGDFVRRLSEGLAQKEMFRGTERRPLCLLETSAREESPAVRTVFLGME